MSKQTIFLGNTANDRTGDPLRTAFQKVNENFDELYALAGADTQIPAQANNGGKILTTNGTTLSWVAPATTGDISFLYNNMRSFSGVVVDNSDSEHGATASLTIPSNGSQSQPVSLTNIYGNININSSPGPGTPKTWTFGSDGVLTMPGSGQLRQDNTILASSSTSVVAGDTAVVFSMPTWCTSAKLVIKVECRLDGDSTDHTQTCEATIAATYNTSADPVMSVYGIVYTSANPLATFTINRTGQNGSGNIEVSTTNTQTINSMYVSVHAVQFGSTFD